MYRYRTGIDWRLAGLSLAITLALGLSATPAAAQMQDKDEQNCINTLNKGGGKVAQARGKANASCIKDAGKGKLFGSVDNCLMNDLKGKVTKAREKNDDGEVKKCTGVTPDFGTTDSTTGNDAAEDRELKLTQAVFGTPVDNAIVDSDTDKAGAGCQSGVSKAYEKLAATVVKEFGKCKKGGLKDGSIMSTVDLAGCVADDAKGKIGKSKDKVSGTVDKKCASSDLVATFPGCGEALAADLSDCVNAASVCQMCLMLNEMDAMQAPCDDIDDGVANATCAQCNNFNTDEGEDCDEGGVDGPTCDFDCTFAQCGDNYVNAASGEECEDLNQVATDPCTNTCRDAVCGDGIVCSDPSCTTGPGGGPEECDLGVDNGGTLCSVSCELPAQDANCPDRGDLILYAGTGDTCLTNADCDVGTCDTGGTNRCDTVTELDTGWTGIAHNQDINDAYGTRGKLVCPGPDPGCGDCIITGLDPEPENCRCASDNRLICDEPFAADADDCGGGICNCYLGAPLPLSSGNTPACAVNRFAVDVTGTSNIDAGSGNLAVRLRTQVFLGETIIEPCPYCDGDPGFNDGVPGGTCIFGRNAGQSCDADELNTTFPAPGGGFASLDCFPATGKNVSGSGLQININSTTGPQSLGSAIACGFPPAFADICPCGLCSLDVTRGCTSNADCTGYGTCGPTGGSVLPKANDCIGGTCSDLGGGEAECMTGPDEMLCDGIVRANGEGFIACFNNDSCTASAPGAGNCSLTRRRACFLDPIEVSGSPDPNTPIGASIFCIPSTSNPAINTVVGIPGPARVRNQTIATSICPDDSPYTPGGSCP